MTSYEVFRSHEMVFTPPSKGDQRRRLFRLFRLSDALHARRANVWEMSPGSEGRRHREAEQEELFVAIDGLVTLRLGDPGGIVQAPQGSIIVVRSGIAVQLLNPTPRTVRVLIVGAPPSTAPAEYLADT